MGKNILKIRFNKSTSSNYEAVINLAKKFSNFKQDEKTNEIIIEITELYAKKNMIQNILAYITSWKYTYILFNDVQIDSSYIYKLTQILGCSNEFEKTFNKEIFCYIDSQYLEGWHCKYISDIKRHIPNSIWDYNRNYGKYWFDFGSFDKNGNWIIDKKSLLNNIFNEVDTKKIFICPYYTKDNIENIVNNLPDIINLSENDEWVINEKDIDNGFTLEKKKIGVLPKKLSIDNNSSSGSFGIGLRITLPKEDTLDNDEKDRKYRNIPNVTFDEIGGLNEILINIREIIELPIKFPELFEHLGIIPHKGILLYGPPGCGKTLIAKAIANEIQAHFINIKGPELLNKYYGQSEENLRNIFDEARKLQPSIIFFDEIDSIAQNRSSNENLRFDSQFVNQLLVLMDGVEDYGNIRILASTNRPELIDEALLRPGRFDYKIEILKPTLQGCMEIFKINTKKMPIESKFNSDEFSNKLIGLTGAEIAFIVRESAYNCIRRNVNVKDIISREQTIEFKNFIISQSDFEYALTILKDKKIKENTSHNKR